MIQSHVPQENIRAILECHFAIHVLLENLDNPLSKWLIQVVMISANRAVVRTALQACTLLTWQLSSVNTASKGNILTYQDLSVAKVVVLANSRTKKAQQIKEIARIASGRL